MIPQSMGVRETVRIVSPKFGRALTDTISLGRFFYHPALDTQE